MVLAAVIDLEPLFTQVIWPAMSIIALAGAGWIVKKIANHTDEVTQQKLRAVTDSILQAGLQLAQSKVASSNIQHVNVQNEIVAGGLQYASDHALTALKKMGIDLSTQEGQRLVAEKLQSMMAPAVMLATASPDNVSVATAATILNPTIPTPPTPVTPIDPANPAPVPTGPIAQLTAGAFPPDKIP